MQNEALLESSLLNSIQSSDDKISAARFKKSDLKASDLDSSARPKVKAKKDVGPLPSNITDMETMVKVLQSQLAQSQKLVHHLGSEIENLLAQNKEMHNKLSEERQLYVDQLNTLNTQFSEEKETLIQEKKDYEDKFNIAKLDIKLGYKEEKIQEFQNRIIELREESSQEINKYRSQVRHLEKDTKEMSQKFETQQDELDKCNSEVIEKQSHIEILSETIQTLQSQNHSSLQAKFLDQNAELCQHKGITKKLESEIKKCFQKLQTKEDECSILFTENEELCDRLEEHQSSYQFIVKQIGSLTTDFETLQTDKNKSLSEISHLNKKNQDLSQKLIRKEDEVRLLKSQILSSKKVFKEKIMQLQKEFNDKIVDFGKNIYPSFVDKEKMLFEDSVIASKSQLKSDSLAESILRMSHLNNSRSTAKPDLSCLKNLDSTTNIEDLLSVQKKLVDQILELSKENKTLEMKVIYSDAKLKEETLSVYLTQEIESLNNHLRYYKDLNLENCYIKEYIVADIDQHKEIKSYEILRELNNKTQKIEILQKRVDKLENRAKVESVQTYQEKLAVEEKVQKELQLQIEGIEKYIKVDLVSLLSDFGDTDVLEVLEKQLISVKKQEQILLDKYTYLMVEREKNKTKNMEMQGIIIELEKKLSKPRFVENSAKDLIGEIENLKLKISNYDSERKDLLKSLDSQLNANKNLKKRVYQLENQIEDAPEHDIDIDKSMRNSTVNKTMRNSINPNCTFNTSDANYTEDKDDQILSLQNKIIAFNQSHVNEMKDLENDKNREMDKLLSEKEQELAELYDNNDSIQKKLDQSTALISKLQEKLHHSERILSEMETEFIENPLQALKKTKTQNPKPKRIKKPSTSPDLSSTNISKKPHQLPSHDFIILPSRLVSILIESKRSEAKAICELRSLLQKLQISEENLEEKEGYVRDLEDEIYKLKHLEQTTRDFDTFGKTKTHQEINVIDEESEVEDGYKQLYQRRVTEVEKQLEYYKQKENEAYDEVVGANKSKVNDIKVNSDVEGYENNFHALLDCIAVLSYQL